MSDANVQMHKLDAGIRYHWDIRIQCRYESIQMVIQQIESYSAHSISQSHFAFNRLKSRKSILLYNSDYLFWIKSPLGRVKFSKYLKTPP